MKEFLLVLIVLMSVSEGMCQSRAFKGSKNIMAHGGISGHGNYVGLAFDAKIKNRLFLGVLAGQENTQQEILQMRSMFFDILARWEMLQFQKLHFMLGVGPSLAFDHVVNSEIIEESATKIGLNYGVHAEYILGRYFLTVGAMQKSYANDKFGKHRYMVGIGVGMTF